MQILNLNLYRDKSTPVNDAYDRLVSGIPFLKEEYGYKLFTVAGCEPETGATTVAVNIAVSLAESGCRTLLADADFRKRTLSKRLGANMLQGLSDLLSGEGTLADFVCETGFNGLHFLSCGNAAENPISLLNSNGTGKFIGEASDMYDYCVFDSPALNTTIDSAVMASKTSGAILVARYKKTKRKKIENAARELEQTGGNLIGIVLNGAEKKEYKRYIENYDYFFQKKGARRKARSKDKK